MAYLADSIWVNVSTSGTADFTTTTALAGYRTFADASTPNGSTIHYSARSATQFENGEGIYSSGTGIVTRATIFASSSAGAKVNFSGSPTLVVAPLAEDFGASALTIGTTTITGGTTKRVLYDLGGVVEEASAFTIESGKPNVAATTGAYQIGAANAFQGNAVTANWFLAGSGNATLSGSNNYMWGGYGTGSALTSGLYNIAIGTQALNNITIGEANVAIGGTGVGSSINSGGFNVLIGQSVGSALQTGSANIFIGQSAGAGVGTALGGAILIGQFAGQFVASGTNLVAIGAQALQGANTGSENVALGSGSLNANTSASFNVGVGTQSLNVASTSGSNTAVGYNALGLATTGSGGGVAIGANAGLNVTTGANNTLVGNGTGAGITTGGNNTILGAAVTGLATGLANAIVIADGAGNIKLDYNKTTASVLTLNADTAVVGTLRLQGYTIGGTLPAAGTAGRRAYVTNSAASPAFMATLTGGGSTVVPVFDDGTNWRYG